MSTPSMWGNSEKCVTQVTKAQSRFFNMLLRNIAIILKKYFS